MYKIQRRKIQTFSSIEDEVKRIKIINNNSPLARRKNLISNITRYGLEIYILDSGEILFNMFDVLVITKFLDVVDYKLDLTRLKVLGFSDEWLDEFEDSTKPFWWSFESVVNFCVGREDSTIFLSALIGYLKSFGTDYFNKWYKKHTNSYMFDSKDPFIEEDADVFYTKEDFIVEKDNLCGVGGDIYVLQFSTGVIKVGKSKNGLKRIEQHVKEAYRYMVKVDKRFILLNSRKSEDALIDFCNKNGKCICGKEYFVNLNYDSIVNYLKS